MKNAGTAANEAINHPEHYTPGTFEVYKVLEAWGIKDRYLWNAMKYLARCGKKDDPSIEIGKAVWYLVRKLAENEHPASQETFEKAIELVDELVNGVDA